MERVGIIERGIFPWAPRMVIVPKKSTPGEIPRRRMCINYKKLNKLQPEVMKIDGGNGSETILGFSRILTQACN